MKQAAADAPPQTESKFDYQMLKPSDALLEPGPIWQWTENR
jgi:hypothetical protein